MQKDSAWSSLGASKQEDTQVGGKCTHVMDPDTQVRGEPCTCGCFLLRVRLDPSGHHGKSLGPDTLGPRAPPGRGR